MQEELVQRAKNGDHGAFESLVRPEIERLYGLAGLLLSDRSRAEDAVQEALLKAWRDLPKLREVGKFAAWLRRLVVNASHDEGRRLVAGSARSSSNRTTIERRPISSTACSTATS